MMMRRLSKLLPGWALAMVLGVSFFALGERAGAQDLREYVNRITEAVAKDDFNTLTKMVDSQPDMAQRATATLEGDICEMSARGDEESVKSMSNVFKQIAITYKLKHKDDSLDKRFKWFSKLTAEQMEVRLKYAGFYNAGFAAERAAEGEGGNDDSRREAVKSYKEAIDLAKTISDTYYVGAAALRSGYIYDKLTDFYAAAYYWKTAQQIGKADGYTNYVEASERSLAFYDTHEKVKRMDLMNIGLPLKESRLAHEKALEASLVVKVEGEGDRGEATSMVPPARPAAYEWETELNFKPVTMKKIRSPWYRPDARQNNPVNQPFLLPVGCKKGEARDFDVVPGARVKWMGKLTVDPDGDKGKARPKPLKLKLDKPSEFRWKITHDDGSTSDQRVEIQQVGGNQKIMGEEFKYNVDSVLVMLVRGISGVKGKVRGHDVTFIDANANGRFNDVGEDAVVIGSGRNAMVQPFGRYTFFPHEDGYYPYEIRIANKGGDKIRSRPYDGDLAPLRVEFEANGKHKPAFLIAKGDGENSDFYIDLMMATEKMMWVPTTGLSVHRGAIFVGKGKKETSILIGRGTSKAFKVRGGQINTWRLGGAGKRGFRIDAKFERSGREVTVKGPSLIVTGNSGEEYFNFLTGVLLPKVEFRKGDENGRKAGSVQMKKVTGPALNDKTVFYPGDAVLEKAPKEPLVAQLKVKNKVLGTIESEWIKIN